MNPWARKSLEELQAAPSSEHGLQRTLGPWNLVLLMYALPNGAWFRFAIWCAPGLALYGLHLLGRRGRVAATPVGDEEECI